ncbi:MAG: aminoacyl-tRNA hydrolase, partial [Salibacteraceae bacterium]|nr:aminoacyl-tRNA hydrolase [Salibacteraceae bacterium]
PGGQHVNKTETQVELLFHVYESNGLDEAEKALIAQKLENRMDSFGVLHAVGNTTRSQLRNKREVTQRVLEMLTLALEKPKPRKKAKPSKAAIQKRLDSKAKLSDQKKNRGWKFDE